MNSIIVLTASFLCGVVGVFLLVKTYRESKEIFLGQETSSRKIVRNAVLVGLSAGLIFMTFELFLRALDIHYNWTVKSFLGSIIYPLIAVLIVTIGVLWRYFIVGKYRGFLFRKLSERSTFEKNKIEEKDK